MIIGLLGLGHLTGKFNLWDHLAGESYLIYARFESVAGLEEGNPVKMLGLNIGRVKRLKMDMENQVALAELKIDKKVTIYDDAFASIKMQGLIGDNYVSIDAGGSGNPLRSGETILDTESLIDITDLISRHAFGSLGKNRSTVHVAQRPNSRKIDWMD